MLFALIFDKSIAVIKNTCGQNRRCQLCKKQENIAKDKYDLTSNEMEYCFNITTKILVFVSGSRMKYLYNSIDFYKECAAIYSCWP